MYDIYVKDEMDKYKDSCHVKYREIVEYAVKGGKCIRAFITKNVMLTLGGFSDWRPVTACEVIHASSLILDDLPCMDNDKIRRNKDSTFVNYGEQKAIMTSILMTSSTIKLLSDYVDELKAKKLMTMELEHTIYKSLTSEWATAIEELIRGQYMDLNMKEDDNVEHLIELKTCSLFSLAFIIGGLFSCTPVDLKKYKRIGFHFGIMFQLIDDINDINDDKKITNFISVKGYKNSLIKFEEEKEKCIALMKSESIYSKEMEDCILFLNNKWKERMVQ